MEVNCAQETLGPQVYRAAAPIRHWFSDSLRRRRLPRYGLPETIMKAGADGRNNVRGRPG